MIRSLDDIRGYTIFASDGEIGHVDDFYFDDATWTVRYLVVDTGPWILGRKVLISPQALGKPDWVGRVLPVELTKEQVKNSPEIDLDKPVSRQKQEVLNRYYNWNFDWLSTQTPTAYGGAAAVPPGPISGAGAPIKPPAPAAEAPGQRGTPTQETTVEAEDAIANSHLRSLDEVIDYDIQALDGEIGHVEDLLVEDDSWVIRYLMINTRDWLPGRDVIISPAWIDDISWASASVIVDLSREEIQESPEFDQDKTLDRQYETRLHEHYNRPYYWE
ncbi:MAG: PRC-barrel domain-containing protein [Candidatus Promineifilaceae bacterium]|nr:PRC-barrel domain-containing protein [Candidatus Promineifilaceae bacterium]